MDYCCSGCFADEIVTAHIRKHGIIAECLLCGGRRRKALSVDQLKEIVEPLVNLYSDIENFMPLDLMKEGAGEHPTLAEKITDDWGLFDDYDTTSRFLRACCGEYHPKHNPGPEPFDPDRTVDDEEVFLQGDYEETQRLTAIWMDLKTEVATRNRFFAGAEIAEDLEDVLANAATQLPRTTIFHRARSCDSRTPHARKEMGAPPAARATAGRANPAGIPYLYLASDRRTAVSELRPHVGDQLCVGSFRLSREQKVIDLREPHVGSPFRWGDKSHGVVRVMGFLRMLGQELSRPIATQNRDNEYLPTQYLCEFLKMKGYDGVLYKSGVSAGFNFALFDTEAARCTAVEVVRVEKVEITLER